MEANVKTVRWARVSGCHIRPDVFIISDKKILPDQKHMEKSGNS
jgi:hypothetical protein